MCFTWYYLVQHALLAARAIPKQHAEDGSRGERGMESHQQQNKCPPSTPLSIVPVAEEGWCVPVSRAHGSRRTKNTERVIPPTTWNGQPSPSLYHFCRRLHAGLPRTTTIACGGSCRPRRDKAFLCSRSTALLYPAQQNTSIYAQRVSKIEIMPDP